VVEEATAHSFVLRCSSTVCCNQSPRIQLFPSRNQVTAVYVSFQMGEEYLLIIHKAVLVNTERDAEKNEVRI
jgi:hypothetical protein